jgi:hypothetical protein
MREGFQRVFENNHLTDVADFSLHEHGGIDCFQSFHNLLGLAGILFEGQGRQVIGV